MRITTITNWAYGATTYLAVVPGTAMILASGADLRERAAVEQRFRLDALSEEIEVNILELTDLARMFVE